MSAYLKATPTVSRFHAYAYDGVWALALAMQDIERQAERAGTTLDDFQYKNETWEAWLIDALDRTSFEGMTVSTF